MSVYIVAATALAGSSPPPRPPGRISARKDVTSPGLSSTGELRFFHSTALSWGQDHPVLGYMGSGLQPPAALLTIMSVDELCSAVYAVMTTLLMFIVNSVGLAMTAPHNPL